MKKIKFSKQYEILFKYRTKAGKKMSRTAFDLLFFLIGKSDLYGETFFHSYERIKSELDCSLKSIERLTKLLCNEGFISIEQNPRKTTIWTVNQKFIDEQIKLIQVKKIFDFNPKSEIEILQEEKQEYADELKATLDSIQDEQMKQSTSEAIDDIYQIQKNNIMYSQLEQDNYSEERIEQHHVNMKEIKDEYQIRKDLVDIATNTYIYNNDIDDETCYEDENGIIDIEKFRYYLNRKKGKQWYED
jgi:hypothetical protein